MAAPSRITAVRRAVGQHGAPLVGVRVVGVLLHELGQALLRAVVIVQGLLQGGGHGGHRGLCRVGHGAVSCCGPAVVGAIIANPGGCKP